MLRQRVITALVLLAVLLVALAASSPWPFIVVTVVMLSAGGWEWARLNGVPGAAAVTCGLLVAGACAATVSLRLQHEQQAIVWRAAALLWLLGGALALRLGVQGWARLPAWPRVLLGLVLLWAAWCALAQARVVGINFLLSLLCVVWMADIAAYFGGRAFGRRKLAPSISPGKSWEGVYSGMAGVLLLAWTWTWLDTRGWFDSPSLFTLLLQRLAPLGMAAAVCAMAGMSVVGDLFESLVKRAAGAKDSSQLLPGHGGVLDRVDALMPVLPIAMALISL